jgi:hypothetical protein
MVGKILKYFYVLATCTCFAHDVSDTIDDGIIHQIAANKNTCVIGVAEERIYLNPNRIYPTDQGLFLNLNDVDYVRLPTLNSDFNGCYVRLASEALTKHPILNTCRECGREYFITCKNPNCSLYQRNEERKREKERQKEEDRERKRQEKEKKKEEKRKDKK